MSTPGGPEYGPYQDQPYGGDQTPYGQPPSYGEAPAPYGEAPAPYVPQQQPYPYGYYQQGYQQGYGGYMPQPGTNGLAIASMILGIVWIYWIGSLLAVIFGHIALAQTARTGQQGRGMAIAGVVLGWVMLALLAVVIVFLMVEADNDGYSDLLRTFFTPAFAGW